MALGHSLSLEPAHIHNHQGIISALHKIQASLAQIHMYILLPVPQVEVEVKGSPSSAHNVLYVIKCGAPDTSFS